MLRLIILGMAIGAVFTGITLSIVSYFATITSTSGGGFLGPEKDWWPVAFVVDLPIGLVLGAVSGAIISGFGINLIKALIFGAILNGLIIFGFYIFANGTDLSDGIKYPVYSLLPIGLFNGVLVSLFTSRFHKST